jgi:transposase
MRKLREIVRLHLEKGLSGRAIARGCGISPSTASEYLGRIKLAKLSWPLPEELDDDAALTRLLFPDEHQPRKERPEPDWARVYEELKGKHVTKQLLWQEYREQHPDGYQYSQFCERYARFSQQLSVVMRQEHRAGEKCFVDFSGDGLELISAESGEVQKVKLFVCVLGASNYTYVEPVLGEDLATWIGCHIRALEYFGGVPEVVVPDNLKAGVKEPDRYEPELNPSYAELAQHYGFAVVPARVRKPRDKAKVEGAVLLAERWVLAALRHQRMSTLSQVRQAVSALLEKLNTRPMRKLKKSRRQLFEELERPVLKPLPSARYELAWWKKARVNIDYHVEVEGQLYSVPYTLVGKQVEVRVTAACVEVFLGGRRVASHVRATGNKASTLPEHMPSSHRAYAQWTPSRILEWAAKVGPNTATLAEELMRRRKHPEQGFRACLGIIRLKDTYDAQRLELACSRALRCRAISYKSVASILRHKLEQQEPTPPERGALPEHENIRGPDYYH